MTGRHTVQLLRERGHTVRVLAHNEDLNVQCGFRSFEPRW